MYTILRLPDDLCPSHPGQVRTIPVDGQDRRVCHECMAESLRVAECNLALDRALHRNHDLRLVGCPFCYPGAIA